MLTITTFRCATLRGPNPDSLVTLAKTIMTHNATILHISLKTWDITHELNECFVNRRSLDVQWMLPCLSMGIAAPTTGRLNSLFIDLDPDREACLMAQHFPQAQHRTFWEPWCSAHAVAAWLAG